MTRPEIVDRSPVEILLDDRGAHIGRARYGRSVPELLPHLPHHLGDAFFRLALCLGQIFPRELDRGDERPAPGPEILRGEFRAEMFADIGIETPLVEVAVRPIAELEL